MRYKCLVMWGVMVSLAQPLQSADYLTLLIVHELSCNTLIISFRTSSLSEFSSSELASLSEHSPSEPDANGSGRLSAATLPLNSTK